MEIKINREIREYTEAMFFGLSLRQFFFSALACAVAVGVYFELKPVLGLETVSWVCVLAAAPFAVLGFLKYNGLTAEQFIWAWIKSEVLMPKHLCFGEENVYVDMFRDAEANYRHRRKRKHKEKETIDLMYEQIGKEV